MARGRGLGLQRDRILPFPLRLPGATLTFPFGDDVNVYKVGVQAASGPGGRHSAGKMFCLIGLYSAPGAMTLKVDPERGIDLVREHECISPGYHSNKRHWITVELDNTVDDDLLRELIEDSYDLVVSSLPARARFDVDPDRWPLPRRGPSAG
jgi:predicted DNA-binding protein (MmcQ/YjbR family)